jgi:uncharacterized protein (DUF885 family)
MPFKFSPALLLGFIFFAPFSAFPANASDAGKRLHELFAQEWEANMREHPTWASQLGDRRYNDKWTDLSTQAIERRHQRILDALKTLDSIPVRELSTGDQLNHELFKLQYEQSRDEHAFQWYLVPLNQRGGIQTQDEIVDVLRFESVKDYEDWIARMRSFPTQVDQTIELMRKGAQVGMIHPKIILDRIPNQIRKQLVDDPAKSNWFKPFIKIPASFDPEQARQLQEQGKQAVAEMVIPAYRKFLEFFETEYLPKAHPSVGAWQNPRGDEMYAFLAKKYTTTELTPDEIHEIGLKEVARIRAQMQKVMESTGFKGTLEEFFHFLRTDPRFFYKDGLTLLAATRAMTREIDPLLVRLFNRIPRMPYGVEAIPMNIAPDTTTAYYRSPAADGSRAGTYFVNLYKPESRPKWEMMALSLHEAVPGHHFQIALAQELGELPMFRRFGGYTAFVEGWGLYAEYLGYELGLYDDPYSHFGALTYEMWRSVRLVVDTGMHHKKWTREQAIEFFMKNAPKSELDIVNEIDRYIAWPGQALAYKIGELKIKELRARATEKLGDTFDVREFHDVVLNQGAVPLSVLQRTVDAWIASQLKD